MKTKHIGIAEVYGAHITVRKGKRSYSVLNSIGDIADGDTVTFNLELRFFRPGRRWLVAVDVQRVPKKVSEEVK